MRKWQKEYFKTKTKEALNQSKKYEREVDKLLAEYGEQSLFTEDERDIDTLFEAWQDEWEEVGCPPLTWATVDYMVHKAFKMGTEPKLPEWHTAAFSQIGGYIVMTKLGPMYTDHVEMGQKFLRIDELFLCPGYDKKD